MLTLTTLCSPGGCLVLLRASLQSVVVQRARVSLRRELRTDDLDILCVARFQARGKLAGSCYGHRRDTWR